MRELDCRRARVDNFRPPSYRVILGPPRRPQSTGSGVDSSMGEERSLTPPCTRRPWSYRSAAAGKREALGRSK
jgi:hypothetical protein